MGQIVCVGHGGFDTAATEFPGVGEILVPPGTTLKFYSDAGHTLSIPAVRDDEGKLLSDYKKIVGNISGWESYQEALGGLSEGQVTYNFALSPEDYEEEGDLAMSLDWDGAEVYTMASGRAYLCEGTPETCPTPKLNVAASRHEELAARGDEAVQAFNKWVEGGASIGDLPDELADFAPRLDEVPDHMVKYVGTGVPDDRWNHTCDGILGQHAGDDIYWMACTSLYSNALKEWKELLAGSDKLDS